MGISVSLSDSPKLLASTLRGNPQHPLSKIAKKGSVGEMREVINETETQCTSKIVIILI